MQGLSSESVTDAFFRRLSPVSLQHDNDPAGSSQTAAPQLAVVHRQSVEGTAHRDGSLSPPPDDAAARTLSPFPLDFLS